jgi:polysaccharide biosynthesis protein PslH
MKLLLLTPKVPYPARDGGAVAAWQMACGLSQAGAEVHILALNTKKHFVQVNSIEIKDQHHISLESVDTDTSIRPLNLFLNLFFSSRPYPLIRFKSKAYILALRKLLHSTQFDIIQCEGLPMTLYLEDIRKNAGSTIVYRAHNLEADIWQQRASAEKNFIKKWYYTLTSNRMLAYEKDLLHKIDILVPISVPDASTFKLIGNTKPHIVIPVGINITPIQAAFNNKAATIGFLGALDWMPNQQGILWFLEKVWPECIHMHPEATIHVAGRNAPAAIRGKIVQAKNVVYEGEVTSAQEFMAAHPLMVVPLFSGSGIRVKILEGMAMGRVIISTPLGASGIPVTHRKNILLAETAQDFIDLLDAYFKNNSTFEAIGREAVLLVRENFDNLALAKRLLDFYNRSDQ